MAAPPQCVADILDCLDELAEDHDDVSVAAVTDAFGARTYGPLITLPALTELTPVGAIPGMPSFLAFVIIIVAAQKMVGRRKPWLPAFITNRQVSSEKIEKSTEKLRPVADFMDKWFYRRLKFMTRSPFAQIAAGLIILLCLTVPFLEVLPFASSVPMLAIAGFGLAVLVRDGVAMIIALAVSFAALGMGVDYWDGGLSDTEQVDGIVDQETVDTVKDGAESAGEAAVEAGQQVQDAAEDVGDAAVEATEDVQKAAEDATDTAASVLEQP